jgi:hypothetical protein
VIHGVARNPPPVWVGQVTVRCPGGRRRVPLVGPTSAEAVRKATRFDPRRIGARCVTVSVEIVKRGPGAGIEMGRARRRRRR